LSDFCFFHLVYILLGDLKAKIEFKKIENFSIKTKFTS